ncbi:hypothetical protein FB45DRAFT_909886 [Roridomyces roridus]|uniref:DUF7330 domain-containing protein n=1 Tax=Roridomyces roridus TaxID=1738132 RepID=A0AAD7BZ74_9AGAR|nr:hypothetical protein FB45DRAFT_909886 [Roridomyces roridus]
MSTEVAPPPTYSYRGGNAPSPSSPAPSEDVVSAQNQSGEQPVSDAMSDTPQPPEGLVVPTENECYPYGLPFPHLRPPSSTPAAFASQARISAFPDHKLPPPVPRLRLTTGAASSSSSSSDTSSTQLFNSTNYVAVHRKTHRRFSSLSRFGGATIKGTFAVDPFLDIPAPLLAPLAPWETTRKNLILKAEDGGIDVDVHLVGEPAPNISHVVRTELHLELCGAVHSSFPLIARIHTPTLRRPPFRASLISPNGFVSLHLPPSFHGLLTVTVGSGDLNARIGLSPALSAHATILSEDGTTRAYFIGTLGSARWEGDRAEVCVERGRVRVQFSGTGERNLDGLRKVGWGLMGI